MDLFNAATMGVDPKTGTYLSKEQRVAMFRASRGQGGGSNGGGNTPKGGSANVKPQSALVVAEKMNGIVKSLSQNFKASTEGVKEQVDKNTQNIQDLYDIYEKQTEKEVKVEKKETRDQKLLAGEKLRKARENMIEGMADAAAKIAQGGSKLVGKALKPVMGFWEKLKKALLFFGGAWVARNLPTLVSTVEDWVGKLKGLQEEYLTKFTDIRGVGSILDNMLKKTLKKFSGLTKIAKDIAKKVAGAAGTFAKKIIAKFGEFVADVAGKIVKAIKDVWQKALNLIPKKPPVTPKPALPAAGGSGGGRTGAALAKTAERGGELAKAGAKGGNIFSGMGNWFKGVMGGSTGGGGAPTATGDLGNATKAASEAKQMSWLQKALKPIAERFPGAMKLFGKFAKGALRTIPVLGFLIDLALNRGVEGEPWVQAILSSLASSTAGAIGAAAGAKAGFALGGAIGLPFGGVGAVVGAPVGAALGGIIGGMLAGMTADNLVDASFEGSADKTGSSAGATPVDGKETASISDVIKPSGEHGVDTKLPQLGKTAFSASTPAGMGTLEELYGDDKPQLIDMPPIIKDMRTPVQPKDDGRQNAKAAPIISTSDSEMNVYRAFSVDEYQMVVAN